MMLDDHPCKIVSWPKKSRCRREVAWDRYLEVLLQEASWRLEGVQKNGGSAVLASRDGF